MAQDAHIKFDGIDGESTHKDHKGEVAVLAWSWSVSTPAAAGSTGGGAGKRKPVAGEFHLTHFYDKASPLLAKKCAQGVAVASAVLTARKSGERQKDYLRVTLKDVFITLVAPSYGEGGDVVEEVSMTYGSIEFGYKPQDAKGGLGTEVTFSWNLKTNVIA